MYGAGIGFVNGKIIDHPRMGRDKIAKALELLKEATVHLSENPNSIRCPTCDGTEKIPKNSWSSTAYTNPNSSFGPTPASNAFSFDQNK